MREALPRLTRIARAVGLDLRGSVVSLDGVYDCRRKRKAIFNRSYCAFFGFYCAGTMGIHRIVRKAVLNS
ncbi:hypothetical protein [Paraburkholderia sp. GAS334]|uniref:hypothetical protein n=1 Tax=Paraburkholderia sp. GAS334 TaxID=3035131 RepID=UPI003D1A51F2